MIDLTKVTIKITSFPALHVMIIDMDPWSLCSSSVQAVENVGPSLTNSSARGVGYPTAEEYEKK